MSFATQVEAGRWEGRFVKFETWQLGEPDLIDEVIGRMDQHVHTETTLQALTHGLRPSVAARERSWSQSRMI